MMLKTPKVSLVTVAVELLLVGIIIPMRRETGF
jgi:hypothetical protein